MNCDEVRPVVNAWIDGELDLVTSVAVEAHVGACGACGRAAEQARTTRAAITPDLYVQAPAGLRGRIGAAVRQAERAAGRRPARQRAWWWGGAAAAAAVAVVGVWAALHGLGRSGSADALLAQEVVASHVRSLMADHLMDVTSTDRHTVKPWFIGQVDFAPTVLDLAEQGFPLVGGRLDYLGQRAVAAMVYRRRQHVINLFEWPAEGKPDEPVIELARHGYHMMHWRQGGLTYWAVSDVAAEDLRQFADLVRHWGAAPETQPVAPSRGPG